MSTNPSTNHSAITDTVSLFAGLPMFILTEIPLRLLSTTTTHLEANPINFLLGHTAPDALVDSGDRRDPPQCSPETRDSILREIKKWANSREGATLIFWLFGSAGVGKSAICQSIAEMFKRKGLLLGNFFFSRNGASTGRSNGDRLLPTLIHQLQEAIPETRSCIQNPIRRDPTIFTKTRASQMAVLYVEPLKKLKIRGFFQRHNVDLWKKVRLVVIDGLDECLDTDVQCDLLRVIAEASKALPIPVRFFIASRPEVRIKDTFYSHSSFHTVELRTIDLDQDQNARQSVSRFLLDEFAKIRKIHPYLHDSWPSEQVIQTGHSTFTVRPTVSAVQSSR
ncbi:hypothetical protein CPB83DRAFT_141713 [Crepidotus variabilis]|uniref:Nephrocystin 3-like N-terminal domain-containing protein n=1 Tax=Crepidotus variabilis TaxID=179855 RepID=A0A9P6E3W6_9AGAR|nr:hypothetical protein CPB83DRAFT_141713 [Crepidotus variabilis]